MSTDLPALGEAGPEAIIPLRPVRFYAAPVNTPLVIWQEVGGVDLSSLSFEADERLALTVERPPALTTASTSVSFEARLNAEQVRLLFGIPLSLIGPRGRHRARSVTRRKYRARARRRT